MANIKVSEMTEATSFDDGDYTMIVQANQNKKISKENMIGDIENDISTINTEISTINTNVGDLTSLITTDKASLVNAINEIKSYITLDNVETFTTGTISGGGTLSGLNITIEKNSDGSLAKIYGQVDVANNGHNGNVTLQTNLRPTEQMVIYQNTYRQISLSGYVRNTALISITINTDGTVVIPYVNTGLGSAENCRLSIFGCLLFIK